MPPKFNIPEWANTEFTREYLDGEGNLTKPFNAKKFRKRLLKQRPDEDGDAIAACVNKLKREHSELAQEKVKHSELAPDKVMQLEAIVEAVLADWWGEFNAKSLCKRVVKRHPEYPRDGVLKALQVVQNRKQTAQDGGNKASKDNITPTSQRLGHNQAVHNEHRGTPANYEMASIAQQLHEVDLSSDDKLNKTGATTPDGQLGTSEIIPAEVPSLPSPVKVDYPSIHLLRADADDSPSSCGAAAQVDISSTPLFTGTVLREAKALLPQYGFLGNRSTLDGDSSASDIFVNTRVPFSTFICGVQGSGKSHTTSCLMENGLIGSQLLGPMESPLSALVLSYGDYGSSGAFCVSEAAYLASRSCVFPDHPTVKKITVLTSPTNPGIRNLYNKLPNVTAIPFKLKPQALDIGAMLTLMAVDASDSVPLYMAKVTGILREMAMESNDDGLNYLEFKRKLWACDFNPTQTAMLELRLGLLDTFLDMSNSSPQPTFGPGEITIMDMSCPFVDANTACILFKIGMQLYLDSRHSGKMIVLDEAHKYMLKVPGAKELNEYLLRIIRIQRHEGVRVIVSTQEPTLLADLIALCSVTIIHRFSSPEWMTALKRHIDISDSSVLQKVESLRQGNALVYAPNAVLGKNEDGSLIKGSGKLLEMKIRKRVTADGGQSVLAS